MSEAWATAERERIDAFHEQFNAMVAAGTALAGQAGDTCYCGGCGSRFDRASALMCGACRCMAYCNQDCQRTGWRSRGHKAACKLLARGRALPPANLDRGYVVQIKLVGRYRLSTWAGRLDREQPELAAIHRDMAAGLNRRERVLFALEARHHALLRFQVIPASKRLEPSDLALFALRAVLEPAADIPTLNMPRDQPRRPYAIWLPSADRCRRPMAEALARELSGAGLPTSVWYVGGGFCAEARMLPSGVDTGDRLLLNTQAELDPDYCTEDDLEEGENLRPADAGRAGAGRPPGTALPPPAAAGAAATAGAGAEAGAGGGVTRVLVVSGMHMFGAADESGDPLLAATATALRGAGLAVDIAMYPKRGGDRRAQQALGERLTAAAAGGGGNGYAACVVLGLGSGNEFKPRNPAHPWGEGPWKDALGGWVRRGGVLVLHGERAVAGVAQSFFGLPWTMEGDWYRRTDHRLNASCPLLGTLARRLPPAYNVKACMLGDVPPAQRVYATEAGAQTHSLVPMMSGEAVTAGRCAMAAATCGEGAVVFFGDVNWEPPTMAAVPLLIKEMVAARAGGVGPNGVPA